MVISCGGVSLVYWRSKMSLPGLEAGDGEADPLCFYLHLWHVHYALRSSNHERTCSNITKLPLPCLLNLSSRRDTLHPSRAFPTRTRTDKDAGELGDVDGGVVQGRPRHRLQASHGPLARFTFLSSRTGSFISGGSFRFGAQGTPSH
ncbi:hypothetical protein VNO77_07546 [Canavalia gladiata]|uniref:Uncharacterized protein n=1 Tax=Canavalia gladiata TaxID=3824 RepID=A0AAN9MBJ1_CANGL